MSIIKSKKKINSIGPSITQSEIDLVTDAVTNGWYDNMSMHIDQFVDEFSAFSTMDYCLPTTNGTSAIHLAMLSLGIGPGDEVILPDITWVASASPIVYVGAKPVFVDINEKDWCICPLAFEAAITEKTKAVVVVDLFGNMPNMQQIRKIAEQYNVFVIEDAAEGIGAEYDGKPAGSHGTIGIFSFNATKLIIAGQGGMLVTNDHLIYEKCKKFAHHGIDKSVDAKYYWSNEVGFNYNWSNIQAALALAQLRRIDELVAKRRQIFSWYKERLGYFQGIQLNFEAKNIMNTYWITTAIVSPNFKKDKEYIVKAFKNYNIDARPFFYPLSMMPAFSSYCKKHMERKNPISYQISPYGICLPSGSNLKESEVDYICNSFKEILLEGR
jgi:perosamine synthetase